MRLGEKVHLQHLKGCNVYSGAMTFEKSNPLRTPNVNYDLESNNQEEQNNLNISGYQKTINILIIIILKN